MFNELAYINGIFPINCYFHKTNDNNFDAKLKNSNQVNIIKNKSNQMQDHIKKKKIQQKLSVLSKYQQIFSNNPQWGRIQYLLQISYGNVSLNLTKIYSIGNVNLQTKFMNKNSGKTIVDCIISEQQLRKGDDFVSICDKGMKQMLNFNYGELDLNKLSREVQDYYEIMIVRCAIGKTYIFPSKNVTDNIPYEQKPEIMDEEFDSLFLYDENYISKEFKQNYIIYEATQKCLPVYIVHFTIQQSKYKELQQKIICELCEDNVAKKYCQIEDSYFCISCDNSHHNNRLGHKHKRTQISSKPKVAGNCPVHPTIRLELFCPQCNRPLCVNCKIKGDHSSGQFLMHPLIRISQRYLETGQMLKQIDVHIDKKKKYLVQSINVVQNRLKDVNRKSTQIEQKIYQMMHKALKMLQNITKKKMSMLMSDHIQLKRQLDQIQWVEKFIKYEYEVLSPNDFLLSWGRHMNIRKQIISDSFQPSKIMPDMRVEGSVTVTTEQQARKNPISKKSNNNQDYEVSKSRIFAKTDDKNTNILKSKIQFEEIQSTGKKDDQQFIKSKSNLLNLSILKHL